MKKIATDRLRGMVNRIDTKEKVFIAEALLKECEVSNNVMLTVAWKKQNPNATPKEEIQFIMSLFA